MYVCNCIQASFSSSLPPTMQDWFRAGVQHLHLTSVDRHPPLQADIDRGVTMIEAHSARKESIYVHCKAGKGRSATLVACYLVKVGVHVCRYVGCTYAGYPYSMCVG